jgi:hypothetical protein
MVEMIVGDHFTDRIDTTEELLLEFNLLPGSVEQRLAARPDFNENVMQQLYDRLREIPPPNVRNGPVRFQIHCRLPRVCKR